MINNMLKPCCEGCTYDDIKIDQTFFLERGRKVYNTKIQCAHMDVCKKYIEYKDKSEE